jgi:glycosyltransferase involved in cell wall biosynthesis
MKPEKSTQRLTFIGMRGLPPDLPGAGGGERETDAKARRLAARGHDVTVYCRWNYVRRPPAHYEGVRLVSLPAFPRAGLETLSHSLLATLHTLLNNTADIVSYHGMGNGLLVPLARLGRKRAVVYMDGLDWERPKWGRLARLLLKWGAAAAFRWADEVYVDNAASQARFAAIFGREPRLITLAADLWDPPGDDLLSEMGLTAENYILFVGMLRPDKGVHMLIDAYTQLDTALPLVIVGDNPDDPAYKQRLVDASDARVKFLGYRYGAEAQQLFANALIYVQPSVMEGNSPALMSAMACGRCVVVNGIEQNRETIGDAGTAFEAGNPADLRAKLAALLADRDYIATLGARARLRIEAVYSWERVVDELEMLYGRLV